MEKNNIIDNRGLAMRAGEALSAKKAQDIVVIDIAEQSSFADFFVIATAGNERHLAALADDVEDALAPEGAIPRNVEGQPSSGWLLMDYGDIIVNIFMPQARETYQLERIWADGGITRIDGGDE